MYQGEYSLIGGEMSFFSRKLEAQLRFQRLPWTWRLKTMERAPEIEARAGTRFIPALETPDGWMLHDTISIGPMLSNRYPDYSIVPETALQRASTFILEDFFNHWLGRSCIHTRWCYPENVDWVGLRLASNLLLDRSIEEALSPEEEAKFSGFGQTMYENFGKNVCDYNGVPVEQAASVKADFDLMLDVLAEHFKQNEFLLGARPCLADFALAGAAKAHYITDPEPLNWLGRHKDMLVGYTDRFFVDDPINAGDWAPDDAVPETLPILLDYVQRSYLKFATANIAAGRAGEKYYEYDYGFGPTKARTQKRLNKARLHVRDELMRIDAANNAQIVELYGARGILDHYLAD
ncbi:MAG: glutathione binding-like protein [Pseudomonadota bacterium]